MDLSWYVVCHDHIRETPLINVRAENLCVVICSIAVLFFADLDFRRILVADVH